MNIHFFIILLISTILSLPVSAQKSEIKFEHLTLENGLSQSTINAILQDSEGFLWFGTQDGLNKYDGYQFTVYRHDPQNTNSLSHNEIFAIYEDSMGTLWLGTGSGLNQFDRKSDKFTHYFHEPQNPNSLSNNMVWSICEDNTGSLWVGTPDGLNKFDRKQNQFVSFKHDPKNPDTLSHNSVWPIYQDSTGVLWIGTNGGINKFDRQHNKFKHYLPDPQNFTSDSNSTTSIYEDSMGILWVGTLKGLHKFDRQLGQFVQHYFHDPQNPDTLSDNAVWAIDEDRMGVLWIATDGGGLNYFDRQSGAFGHYQHNLQNPSSLNNNAVLSLHRDRAGTLWVGTEGGANMFNQEIKKFAHYFHNPIDPNSLNNNFVLSIYEDRDSTLWVGTKGGLNKFGQDKKVTHYKHDPQNATSISHNEVWSITEDSAGILWIGTFGGGLNVFNREQNQFKAIRHDNDNPDSLIDNYVLSIYEDSNKILWVGTREGLDKFDRQQNKFVHYLHEPKNPNSLSNNVILSIYEDQTATLWIGTQEGLNKFDRQRQTFARYQHDGQNPTSLSHNEISAIYEDDMGTLWVGTYGGGLNKFDRMTGHFHAYREKDGLANDTIYGILSDNQGNLWLSTNKGLSKFNLTTETFRNYDVLDGLQSNEFNSGSYHKGHSGKLFFGGINGFNAFYPKQVKDNPYVPPIVITKFEIFNESPVIGGDSPLQQHINETREMTLSYMQSFFSFEFAALNFIQPTRNEYSYQLEGFDNKWNNVGTRRNAYYTNVPHGIYVFRLKGSNNDKVWNDEGTTLKITVLPPPWETWWAYTLYVITILGIIIGYILVQRQKLLEKQLELEREQEIAAQLKETDRLKDEFLANTSHELRTPLNGIIGIAESLVDGATGQLSQLTQENLTMIVGSGRRLLSLVNDILDFSKLRTKEIDLQIKSVDMRTITELVLTLSQPLVSHKKVKLINVIPSDLPLVNADENRVQQILYNLVGNAIKFTEAGTVEVSVKVLKGEGKGKIESHSSLAITVSDTGIGIAADKLEHIFEAFEQGDGSTARIYGGTGLGLAVTQQLVNLHGGQLTVQSKELAGSQFTFTLPISNEQLERLPKSGNSLSLDSQPLSSLVPTPTSETTTNTSLPEITTNTPLPKKPLAEISTSLDKKATALSEGEYTILIVDDEPVNRQVLVNHLSLQDYSLKQAASGMEALAILDEGCKVDIILLDVMMPYMIGYEVTKKVRQTWQADELPIILLTAKNQVADLVIGLESGANDYLTKPVSKDELLARIKTHLNILQLKAETLHLAIENKNRLMQFLESVPIGIGVHDTNGTLFYHNQRARQILGVAESSTTIEQLVSVAQLYIADTQQPYPVDKLPIMQALNSQSSMIEDVEIHHPDKIIPLEIWGNPIFDENGNIVYAINTLQDITERKMAIKAQEKFTQDLFQLNKAYERFVPQEFLSLLDKQSVIEVNLGDHIEKEITILFSDIRDFTTISEAMTPSENFAFINAYLGQMEPIISQHHGFIDKYIGDAIMALFSTGADDAVRGSIAMLKKLFEYNKRQQKSGHKSVSIGIGLNTGPLMLGTVGGQNRMDGTVIADAVNLASRVEGLTKIYGTPLLITQQTFLKLTDPSQYHVRVIDAVRVKGKSEVVTIYEIFDAEPLECLTLKEQTRADFEKGFVCFHQGEYQSAQSLFENVLQINPKDKSAQVYLQRCQQISAESRKCPDHLQR